MKNKDPLIENHIILRMILSITMFLFFIGTTSTVLANTDYNDTFLIYSTEYNNPLKSILLPSDPNIYTTFQVDSFYIHNPGEEIGFQSNIAGYGTNYTNNKIIFPTPQHLTYVDNSTVSTIGSVTYDYNTKELIWTIDLLPQYQMHRIEFNQKLNCHLPYTLEYFHQNSTWYRDHSPPKFTTSNPMYVDPIPFFLCKLVNKSAAITGTDILYSLYYKNAAFYNGEEFIGYCDYDNVVLNDTIPANTTYIDNSATTSHGTISYDRSNQILTWNIGFLSANESGNATFKVKINNNAPPNTEINNTAYIRTESDPLIPSNSAITNVTPLPVLLVHGYFSEPKMWNTMKLKLENEGYIVYCSDYAPGSGKWNANGNIKEYAVILSKEIDDIKSETGVEKVDLVVHSMGGLISRWYTTHGYKNDVRKLIMIATPNHGSELCSDTYATMLSIFLNIPLDYHIGKARTQMIPGSTFLNELNHGPWYRCSGTDTINSNIHHEIIAGTDSWFITRWILKGDDDGVVRVDSAQLDGVIPDLMPYNHITLCQEDTVFNKVLYFLQDNRAIKPQNLVSMQAQQSPLMPVQEIPEVFSFINSSEEKSHNIPISFTNELNFFLLWQEGDINFTLITPNGTQINPFVAAINDNVTYYSDENFTIEGYDINNPESGIWTVNVTAINISEDGQDYSIRTLLDTNLTISFDLDTYYYYPNEDINITVSVTNNGIPLTGTSVAAIIEKPDKTTDYITLYDDGSHGDYLINDGIYSNIYSNTNINGIYNMIATASGSINDEHFIRETFITVWVEQYPDLTLNASDISFSNNNPNIGDNITITANIHNIGYADASNASILFFNGPPVNNMLIGEDKINIAVDYAENAHISWITESGTHKIYVIISPYNEFLEENYLNNEANKSIPFHETTIQKILLEDEWNLISTPLNLSSWELGDESIVGNPLNTTPKNSLTSIYRYITIGAFEKCDHFDDWGWCPATGSESFTELEPGEGYWVMAKNDCDITFTGTYPSDLDLTLAADWNLIGWYSTTKAILGEEAVVGDPLNTIPKNSLTSIYRYNTTIGAFEKCDHFNDWGWYPATGSESFTKLEPGRGYWVMAENECIWKHEV